MRRNSEVHHFDLLGAAGVITGAGGAVVSIALCDAFGVARFAAGHAATPWRLMRTGEEGLVSSGDGEYLPRVAAWLRRRLPSGTGFAGPIRAWIEPARTDQERCLQGSERKHHLGLAKCAKKLHDCRRSLRGRLDPIYRRHVCLSRATLCTGRAIADYLQCQMDCHRDHLL